MLEDQIKWFLDQTIDIPGHTEKYFFLHTEELTKCNKFRLSGEKNVTINKNIIVYNNDNAANTNDMVTLHCNTLIVWLQVVPTQTLNDAKCSQISY